MQAAVVFESGRPAVFHYEEVPDPVCDPGGVLIDVRAVSIEGGDDSRFPLAEAAEARRRIESRLAFGRVLLIP